jgi:5'-phosphate synthase pdxT subunit
LYKIGILAIQGDFYKHCRAIEFLGHQAIEVRSARDLKETDALIIPGGESTTLMRLFKEFGLGEDIKHYAENKPIMGTCAGLIILSTKVDQLPQDPLGLIDLTVSRNAYGRQKESFVADISLNLNGKTQTFPGVFIRAPKIDKAGKGVNILASHGKDIVMVSQRNILAATFHPELTDKLEIHQYFINKFI